MLHLNECLLSFCFLIPPSLFGTNYATTNSHTHQIMFRSTLLLDGNKMVNIYHFHTQRSCNCESQNKFQSHGNKSRKNLFVWQRQKRQNSVAHSLWIACSIIIKTQKERVTLFRFSAFSFRRGVFCFPLCEIVFLFSLCIANKRDSPIVSLLGQSRAQHKFT